MTLVFHLRCRRAAEISVYEGKKMFKQEKRYYKQAFFYALLMSLIFLPFVIIDGGYFVFYGDYNAQQIPFYKTCIEAIHQGNLGWNWNTDLGVNFVGSYSFYTLGSPFFWFAALFPASISHYLMAPLLMLKLALSSLFAFIYIRRFVSKPEYAVIGGLLYAFSGFSMYNIFFNHFHEAIVFFPLLLIGLEEAVVNKRRGAFALAVAINAFVNYFFFIGECVFLVIYFIARLCCDKRFRISVGDFFCLAFESVIGVAIAGALFVPSIFQVLDVPRSTALISGKNFLFHDSWTQRYGLLLEAMFFPPEIPARTHMFPEAGAKWSSVALYLPLFSMAGVASFIGGAKRRHWLRPVLITCFVMAFVPGLNSMFVLFNGNFYTRWFYMLELMCALATVYALEHSDECDMRRGLAFTAVTTGVIALLVMLHPVEYDKETVNEAGVTVTEKATRLNIFELAPSFYIQLAIAVAFMVLLGILIRARRKNPEWQFRQLALTLTVICSMVLGLWFIGYGRILGPYVRDYDRAVTADISIDDPEFYRIEGLQEMNNVNMLWDKSSLKSFTSIIPSSTFELYELLDITRDVNSAPDADRYALRALTRVKYVVVRNDRDEEKVKTALDELQIYEHHSTCGDYEIYSTDLVLPMGFAYDGYVTYEYAEDHGAADKLMCRAVVLTEEQTEKYSDILDIMSESDTAKVSLSQFKEDVLARQAAGVSTFNVTNTGFTATTDYTSDELVVFSVPFDKGWKAEVNGAPAEVEKVNGGFVAVRVPAGKGKIVFTYETPGGRYGIILTIGGIILYGIYIFIQYVLLRRRPKSFVHLYDQEQIQGVRAHRAYISQLARSVSEAPEAGNVPRPLTEEQVKALRELDIINIEDTNGE